MIKVKRLGHATIATPDIEGQTEYYGRVLGLSIVERHSPIWSFLNGSDIQ